MLINAIFNKKDLYNLLIWKMSMKITVITAVYNNKRTILEALESVLSQSYKNVEHIVIDGGSTDGTVEAIRSFGNKIEKFVSEPDGGIYDALNKGIALATGDVVGFLNSDDVYAHDRVLEKIVRAFQHENADSVYGDLNYVKRDDISKVVRHWKSHEFSLKKLRRGWMPPHPTFYVKREIYEKYGGFDTSFKIAADYDSILRFLGLQQISTTYVPEVLVQMRLGGVSNRDLKSILKKSGEDYKALKKNGIGGKRVVFMKNFSKVSQFIKREKHQVSV